MKKLFKQPSSGGFTLIELLVVATIIILLTTIGIVSYRNAARNSRNAKRKADMETVRQAMIMYRSENGEYPKVTPSKSGMEKFDEVVTALRDDGYLVDGEFVDPHPANVWPCRYRVANADENPIQLLYCQEIAGTPLAGSDNVPINLP